MNERIQQLAEQAEIHFSKSGTLDAGANGIAKFVLYSDLEKFAQLIVRECIKLCEHEANDDEYDQYDMEQSVKAENTKALIMKEFGVEE